jgi:hypothetical protein
MHLTGALLALIDANDERKRTALLAVLGIITSQMDYLDHVKWSGLLSALMTRDDDRRDVLSALDAALPKVGSRQLVSLASMLLDLDGGVADSRRALAATLSAIPSAESQDLTDLAKLLAILARDRADKRTALEVLTAALRAKSRWNEPDLVRAWVALVDGESDRRFAVVNVFEAIKSADPSAVSALVDILLELGAGRAVLQMALSEIEFKIIRNTADVSLLAPLLPKLHASDWDRERVLGEVMIALGNAMPGQAVSMARLLPELNADSSDRRTALIALASKQVVGRLLRELCISSAEWLEWVHFEPGEETFLVVFK